MMKGYVLYNCLHCVHQQKLEVKKEDYSEVIVCPKCNGAFVDVYKINKYKKQNEETRCKHKWVDMEDGTNDQFCVKCSEKQKQAMVLSDIGLNLAEHIAVGIWHPIVRESITINLSGSFLGGDVVKIAEEFNKLMHERVRAYGI